MDLKLEKDQANPWSPSLALMLIEEGQRKKFAQDLHDSVGTPLAAARLDLDWLAKKIDSEELIDRIQEINNTLQQVTSQIRLLISEMSVAPPYEGNILTAIEKAGKKESERSGFAFDVNHSGSVCQLAEDQNLCFTVYRVVRELLHNVSKHAEATAVKVNMDIMDGFWELSVADNGKGFDPEKLKNSGGAENRFGLFSIQEQITSLGGNVYITSNPTGTCVRLRIPFSYESFSTTDL